MDKKSEEIRYIFTKYLETAVIRTRKHYIEKEMKRADWEELTEDVSQLTDGRNEWEEVTFYAPPQEEVRMADADTIRSVWDQYADGTLRTEVLKLNDKELLILFAKVYGGLNFTRIGEILHLDAAKTAHIYAYARKKLKKGCGPTNGV